MKYRRLTNNELNEVETAFVRFLASNSVTADDWVKLKEENPDKAEGLIELFSDIVFENTLKKAAYLTHASARDIKVFHCQAEKMVLIGLTIEGDVEVDMRQTASASNILELLQQSDAAAKIYTAQKSYQQGGREQELFQMMENGCLISEASLFEVLESALPNA